MTMPDLKELREKAEAATVGPWVTEKMSLRDSASARRLMVMAAGEAVAGRDGVCVPDNYSDRTFVQDDANMAFIAAVNPSAILALLDLVEAEKVRRESAERLLKSAKHHAETEGDDTLVTMIDDHLRAARAHFQQNGGR